MYSLEIKIRKVTASVLLSPVIWTYWLTILFIVLLGAPLYWVFTFMFLFVILFNFLPYFLIKNLESFYQNTKAVEKSGFVHYLVLGGGHTPDSHMVFEQQLNNSSLRRVLEGVRLFNLNPKGLLVMSGESLKEGHPSQAEIQAKVAITMGIDEKNIKIIPEPINTEEEAIYYNRNFGSHNNTIYLITKALHMKRALFIFSSYDYQLVPAPSYFVYRNFTPSFSWFIAPQFQLMIHFGEYLKEFVGYNILKFKLHIGLKSNPRPKDDYRKTSLEIFNR